jgi:hypothetical protein
LPSPSYPVAPLPLSLTSSPVALSPSYDAIVTRATMPSQRRLSPSRRRNSRRRCRLSRRRHHRRQQQGACALVMAMMPSLRG